MEITSVNIFLDYYKKLRERTNKLVHLIPPDKLEWAYMPGKFSIGDLVRHIAGIERFMFSETIAGRPSAYPGCGKEVADGYENVINYFHELHRQSIGILAKLSDEDLKKKCVTPAAKEITIWKWMRAMAEHEIHHRGQLYVYLNMVGVKTPPMFGLTSEEVQQLSAQARD